LFITLLLLMAHQATARKERLNLTGWEIFWSEEFNSVSVDSLYGPDRWKDFIYPGPGIRPTRRRITLADGLGYFKPQLVRPDTSRGDTVTLETAELMSTFDEIPEVQRPGPGTGPGFLYGIFEIRCKLPAKYTNVYTAFWLSGITWPPEIDAFEYHAGDNSFFSSIHYGAGPQNHQTVSQTFPFSKRRLTRRFHTWTIVWLPDRISIFFDGKELMTDTTPSHLPHGRAVAPTEVYNFMGWNKMDVRVGNALLWRIAEQNEQTDLDPLVVDYIRVYKPKGYAARYQYADYTTTSGNRLEDWYFKELLPLYARTRYLERR
jgi:hypothetical protein